MNENKYDQLQNEGFDDGYNPYRDETETASLPTESERRESQIENDLTRYRKRLVLAQSATIGDHMETILDLKAKIKSLRAERSTIRNERAKQ